MAVDTPTSYTISCSINDSGFGSAVALSKTGPWALMGALNCNTPQDKGLYYWYAQISTLADINASENSSSQGNTTCPTTQDSIGTRGQFVAINQKADSFIIGCQNCNAGVGIFATSTASPPANIINSTATITGLTGLGYSVATGGDYFIVGGKGFFDIYYDDSETLKNVYHNYNSLFPSQNFSVDINDDTIPIVIVGIPSSATTPGIAYVYQKNTTTGNWESIDSFASNDKTEGFGKSVSINAAGDTIAVGAPDKNTVYVYKQTSSQNWSSAFTLTSPSNLASQFGYSVDVQGDRIIVGAPGGTSGNGVAYVFQGSKLIKILNSGTLSQTPSSANGFGFSVSIALDVLNGKDIAIVGSPKENSNDGKVYLFDVTPSKSSSSTNLTGLWITLAVGGFFGITALILYILYKKRLLPKLGK